MMMVGAGVGLTPSASILRSVLKYRWRKGFDHPSTLRFYWIVRHSDVKAFTWFIFVVLIGGFFMGNRPRSPIPPNISAKFDQNAKNYQKIDQKPRLTVDMLLSRGYILYNPGGIST